MAATSPGAVELRHAARVRRRERVGALLGLGDHRDDGGFGIAGAAVEQRVEVPGDGLEFGIGHVGRGHAPHGS